MNDGQSSKHEPGPIQNIDLEQQILGALLTNNELLFKVGGLEPEHFYDPVHAEIFRKIRGRVHNEHIASPVTLKGDMELHEGLQSLGGAKYLVRLAGASIASFAITDYSRELRDIWQRRSLRDRLLQVQERLEMVSFEDAISDLQLIFTSAMSETDRPNSISFLRAMISAVDQINAAYSGKKSASVNTGIPALDRAIGGFYPGNMIVLGGRPSMGKTAIAIQSAYSVAQSGGKVVIVSSEMTQEELAERILSMNSGVVYADARRGEISEPQMRRIVETAKELENIPIAIVPDHVRDVGAILSACKSERERMGGLDLVVVDYLQLLRSNGKSRVDQISEISMQIKSLAKLLRVPVLALSQLSRGVEARENKRPMLSDLRESGQIEQDADVVLFCYRDHYYLEREGIRKSAADEESRQLALQATKSMMEIIVAKQRMGGLYTIKVGCHLPTNRFWDLSQGDEQQEAAF